MNKNQSSRRINILRDSVARRIAAGEVIDRPQAVVRELLDNSIDADASEISLSIRGGGIEEIRVVDNGIGMDEENLKKCFLPHATSKISEFEDIYRTTTLGFRGEALSSIAACSRLSIISSTSNDLPAHRLEIQDGKIKGFGEHRGSAGSLISVKDLFYSMPGRKNFLKSASAESGQCRSMFIEKALPHLNISFRYFVDDNLKLFLPASDLKTRIQSAYGGLFHNDLIREFSTESEGINLRAAAGTPSLYRKDRKYIQVFINNRRVSDYSLIQAVDYAYSSYLPGGCHPVCFLFLEIPPEHIDFNIHPAKREVKFRNLPSIHHTVTSAIGNFLSRNNSFDTDFRPEDKKPANNFNQKEFRIPPAAAERPSFYTGSATPADSIFRKETLSGIASGLSPKPTANIDTVSQPETQTSTVREATAPLLYLGQIFELFLVFEYGENLLLIDQHAAHERIIFNELSSRKHGIQELLVPVDLNLERDEEEVLEKNIEEYKGMGFNLQKISEGEWLINAMPSLCSGMEDAVISFFRNKIKDAAELKKELYAMISCRSAIKDRDSIDDISALELADSVLKLDNPRCPHGRPVIQMISRDRLFRMFGRTF